MLIKVVAEAAERVGGAAELARRLGITTQALHQWRQVPADRVADLERATGIPRSRFRSDLYRAKDSLRGASLYHADYYLWLRRQIEFLEQRWFDQLDTQNLIEELRDLGRSEQREVESRLGILLCHLLKWKFQPDQRSGSWRATILEQRARIIKRLQESPSLKDYPGEVLQSEYALARGIAAAETGLAVETFSERCPFSVEQVLDLDFLP
jgi:hypothetical protein